MTFALTTEPVNGVVDVTLRRDSKTRIIISTSHELDDNQMQDLYWITLAMFRTGKTFTELMKENKH